MGFTIETSDANGFTALLHAVARSDLSTIKALVERYKANILKIDNIGRTALMLAAGPHLAMITCKAQECSLEKKPLSLWGSSHLGVVKYLIDQGCPVNAVDHRGNTALMYAALAGRGDVVEYLVQKGADINKKNSENKTALDLARQTRNVDIITFISNPIAHAGLLLKSKTTNPYSSMFSFD